MSSSVLRNMRARRHLPLLLAAAILLAGIAQAAHYHKNELAGGNSTDVHCLLCLYGASGASPPAAPQLVPATALILYRVCLSGDFRCPDDCAPASYNARAPPSV